MATTPDIEKLISGITRTSEKVRVLANAGFDRSQIARALDIRYQHVRNILMQSGFSGGLKQKAKAERETIDVDTKEAPHEDTSTEVLLQGGFQLLGEWTSDPNSAIQLEARTPDVPGVYAFAVDDRIVYVGVTLASLMQRMDQYRRGYKGQRTNERINGYIAEHLALGKRVQVLAATPEPSEWNGNLPINTAAGLEVGLIQLMRPSWNIRGAS